MNPQMMKMVVTNTVHQVEIKFQIELQHKRISPTTSKGAPFLQKGPFLQNPFFQDYSNCHESITEKLVVIDVSDVIGEAIRYLILFCNVLYWYWYCNIFAVDWALQFKSV